MIDPEKEIPAAESFPDRTAEPATEVAAETGPDTAETAAQEMRAQADAAVEEIRVDVARGEREVPGNTEVPGLAVAQEEAVQELAGDFQVRVAAAEDEQKEMPATEILNLEYPEDAEFIFKKFNLHGDAIARPERIAEGQPFRISFGEKTSAFPQGLIEQDNRDNDKRAEKKLFTVDIAVDPERLSQADLRDLLAQVTEKHREFIESSGEKPEFLDALQVIGDSGHLTVEMIALAVSDANYARVTDSPEFFRRSFDKEFHPKAYENLDQYYPEARRWGNFEEAKAALDKAREDLQGAEAGEVPGADLEALRKELSEVEASIVAISHYIGWSKDHKRYKSGAVKVHEQNSEERLMNCVAVERVVTWNLERLFDIKTDGANVDGHTFESIDLPDGTTLLDNHGKLERFRFDDTARLDQWLRRRTETFAVKDSRGKIFWDNVFCWAASAAHKEGDPDMALRFRRQSVSRENFNPDNMAGLGWQLGHVAYLAEKEASKAEEGGRTEEAAVLREKTKSLREEALEAYVAASGARTIDHPMDLGGAAGMLWNLGRLEEAEEYFKRADEVSAAYVKQSYYSSRHAYFLRKQGKAKEAGQVFEAAFNNYPQEASLRFEHASFLGELMESDPGDPMRYLEGQQKSLQEAFDLASAAEKKNEADIQKYKEALEKVEAEIERLMKPSGDLSYGAGVRGIGGEEEAEPVRSVVKEDDASIVRGGLELFEAFTHPQEGTGVPRPDPEVSFSAGPGVRGIGRPETPHRPSRDEVVSALKRGANVMMARPELDYGGLTPEDFNDRIEEALDL